MRTTVLPLVVCRVCSRLYLDAVADQHLVIIQPLLSEGSEIFGKLQSLRNIQNSQMKQHSHQFRQPEQSLNFSLIERSQCQMGGNPRQGIAEIEEIKRLHLLNWLLIF